MEFLCPEGHNVNTTWRKMRSKYECPVCNANVYKNQTVEVLPKRAGVKRSLGLDQATRITGYAIYDNDKLIKYGTFQADGYNTIDRDASVRNWLVSLI